MSIKLFLSALFSFVLFLPSVSTAQNHSVFCDGSDSTAASVRCLNRHLSAAQNRLNKLYEKLSITLEGENLAALRFLQKNWLSYRDEQCDWEARQTEISSLERVNKLSCLARMSEDRADVLSVILADEELEGAQRQFGDFPRWMNVLAKDEPEIFWNYGKKLRVDLNCDGENEMVMGGLRVKKVEDFSDISQDGSSSYSLTFMLAIAENPPTGRPQTYILPFVVGSEVCSSSVSLNVQEKSREKSVAKGEEQVKDKKCGAQLLLSAKGCDPIFVVWSDKTYQVQIKEEDSSEKNDADSKEKTIKKKK